MVSRRRFDVARRLRAAVPLGLPRIQRHSKIPLFHYAPEFRFLQARSGAIFPDYKYWKKSSASPEKKRCISRTKCALLTKILRAPTEFFASARLANAPGATVGRPFQPAGGLLGHSPQSNRLVAASRG